MIALTSSHHDTAPTTATTQEENNTQRVRRCCSIVVVYAHIMTHAQVFIVSTLSVSVLAYHSLQRHHGRQQLRTPQYHTYAERTVSTRATFVDAHPHTLPSHSRTNSNEQQPPPQDHVYVRTHGICVYRQYYMKDRIICSGQHFTACLRTTHRRYR